MNDGNKYENSSWYEPLQRAAAQPPEPEQMPERKRRRGWTPGRVLAVLALVTLMIVGSSLALANHGLPTAMPTPAAERGGRRGPGDRADTPERDGETETPDASNESGLPDDWAKFFEGFYQTVETEEADIRMTRAELPIDFTLTLDAPGEESMSLHELYTTCVSSIVGVSAYTDGEDGYGWGSGVVLSEDGLILTNVHIINGADRAVVTLDNDEEYEAALVGADPISDVAVLKIEASGLPVASYGDSTQLRVGDPVSAIGNPLGKEFRNTLTNGIVSAIERGVSYNGRTMTLLQTNTALNEGNSGGALFNEYGQVVGVTNMKMMSAYSSIEGIGFAIPSTTVQRVVNALCREGEVRGRPAIGITVGEIPEQAKAHYELPEGLYVTAVSEGSDAEAQGILPGDIVTAVDGVPVRTTQEIAAMKDALQVGDRMTFSIWRDGEELEIAVMLVDTNDVY